jgi:hypothetical protein
MLKKVVHIVTTVTLIRSRESSVGIATGHRGSIPDRDKVIFSIGSRRGLGPTPPPIQWAPGAISLGVEGPEREADHSPPSSAKVRTVELYLHSPIYLHDVVLN